MLLYSSTDNRIYIEKLPLNLLTSKERFLKKSLECRIIYDEVREEDVQTLILSEEPYHGY